MMMSLQTQRINSTRRLRRWFSSSVARNLRLFGAMTLFDIRLS